MSGIIFGAIVPHPPIIVPEVGKGEERRTAATIKAMGHLAGKLAGCNPQTLVIISPHGQIMPEAMGVAKAEVLTGNLRSWGAADSDHSFKNDSDLIAALEKEAKEAGVPLKSIGGKSYQLDHGVMVPMYFLSKKVQDVAIVPLTYSWLSREHHFRFGKALRRAAESSGKRVALIASGDLSHRLLPESPAGYDPVGKVFDKELVTALRSMDQETVLGMDEEMTERAGECGLRSIVILLGALEGLSVKPRILSYEGPFGVGYLVAAFEISKGMGAQTKTGEHPFVHLARSAVEAYIGKGEVIAPPCELSPEMSERAGVFVCIKRAGELRGCIGTFEPTRENVAEEIVSNAISTATRDPRFWPISSSELGEVDYTVDVLTAPESVQDRSQLDPKKYGIIVESKGLRGLLLPDLEGVNTVEEQIEICRQKAGIGPDDPVKLYRFQVKRYT